MRGVAGKIVAARAARDGVGEKKCGFEKNVPAVRLGLGRIATHDAGKPDRARGIGDAQHGLVHVDALLVEELQPLPLPAEAHVDAAGKLVQIVDVERASKFQHHVIGHVHQRRNRALAGACQALLHPCGHRRGGVDVADHAAGEPPASVCRGNLHREARVAFRRDRRDRGCFECGAGDRRHFTRDPEQAQTIGAIRRELEREHDVVQFEHFAHVAPDRRIGGERQQTRMVVLDPQFHGRTQHALALRAAHARALDLERLAVGARQARANQGARNAHAGHHVGCAAHDRERRRLAHIDPAQRQAVGVGVARHFQDLGHHHFGKRRHGRLD